MRTAKVYRISDRKVFADPCMVADSVVTRFKGLMGQPGLAPRSGLWIQPCNSIHTFFMRFPIDVVYLGRGGEKDRFKVLVVRQGVRPWRMDFPVFGAKAVLELPDGGAGTLSEGDILCLS